DNLNSSVGVNGGIVPGGDDLLGLVPCRRDVGVRAGEDRQSGLSACLPPLRVRPCHVTDQGAVLPGCPFEEEGQVGGEGQAIDLRYEEAEAVLLDEVVQLGQVGFGEGGGYVHRRASRFIGGGSACFLSGLDTALSQAVAPAPSSSCRKRSRLARVVVPSPPLRSAAPRSP